MLSIVAFMLQKYEIFFSCRKKVVFLQIERSITMDSQLVKQIGAYFATQPVQRAWLFGSYARGEQREDSDIDILVAFDPNVGLFKYAAIYTDLKELLGREVDLVQEGALKPYAAATADRDKILIYERPTSR
jgi:predicted nucleotidyltransferase